MDVRLETDRLLLRPFQSGDEEGVLEFASNPLVQQYTGDIIRTSLEEIRDVIQNIWQSDYQKYGYGRFAVIHKADNKIIGFNGIKYLPEIDETDLGYRFLPEYWNKGIATESSKPILDFAFNDRKLDKVIGFVETENPASATVLKKLGFAFTKVAHYPGEEDQKPVEWYHLTNDMHERQ